MKTVTAYESDNSRITKLFRTEEDCIAQEKILAEYDAYRSKIASRPWPLRYLFPILIAVGVVTVASLIAWGKYRHNAPAPGYRLMCDGKGKWGFTFPDEHSLVFEESSRREAIHSTWRQHRHDLMGKKMAEKNKNKPKPPEIHWMDCSQ